jgi:hypothetical protein
LVVRCIPPSVEVIDHRVALIRATRSDGRNADDKRNRRQVSFIGFEVPCGGYVKRARQAEESQESGKVTIAVGKIVTNWGQAETHFAECVTLRLGLRFGSRQSRRWWN